MNQKRNSEEELDLEIFPPFLRDFLETIRDFYTPEERREIISLFEEKERRLREDQDKFLQELIQSLS